MYWDGNRDTDHRTGVSPGVQETGQPDGTYLNALSSILVTQIKTSNLYPRLDE